MPLDVNVFDKLKSFQDYQKADQAFQLQKALTTQQIQTGGIDAASKANVFATQVLSSATDQASYDKGKSLLNGYGIDTSGWSPDFQTGQQQAYQARLAQSPLGTLFNAEQKIIGNNIAGTSAMGTTDNQFTQPVPSINPLTGQITITPQVQPKPVPQPVANGTAQVFDQPVTAPPAQGVYSPPAQPLQSPNQPPPFVPPLRDPNGTQAAYQQKYQQALEAWKVDPRVIAGIKQVENQGGKKGDQLGDASKTLDIMQSNLPTVLERFQNMRKAASDASYGYGVDNEGSGFKQAFNNQFNTNTGDANQQLKQYAAQGILPELGPQLAQAGIRGNKFLETLASSASGLDLSASPDAKGKLIDGLENTYIRNLKSTAAQLRANGQQAPSDDQIDQAVAQYKSQFGANLGAGTQSNQIPAIKPSDAINELRRRGKI